MGFFNNIKFKVQNVFGKKEEISKERIKQVSVIKTKFDGFDFNENTYGAKHLMLMYNGYIIAVTYKNIYIKKYNYEFTATDAEKAKISDIYLLLDDIYAEKI